MDSKLVIDDDYIYDAAAHAKKCAVNLNNVLTSYIKILNQIRSDAIMSGDVAEALSAYISTASKLSGTLKEIGTSINSNGQKFVSAVDDADDYLF